MSLSPSKMSHTKISKLVAEQSVMEEVSSVVKMSLPAPGLMNSETEEDQSKDSDVEIVAVSTKDSEGNVIGDVIEIESDEDSMCCDMPMSWLGSSSQAETVAERKDVCRSETFDSLNNKSVNNIQNSFAEVAKVDANFTSLEKSQKSSYKRLARIPWIKSRMKKWPYMKKRLTGKSFWSRSGSCSLGKTKLSKTQVVPEPIVVYKHISWEDIYRKHKDILPVSMSDRNFDEMSVLQEQETNDSPDIKSVTELESQSSIKPCKTKTSDIIKKSMKKYPGVELKELRVNLRQCYMKPQPPINRKNENARRNRNFGLNWVPRLFVGRFDSDSHVMQSNESASSEKVNQELIQTQNIFKGSKWDSPQLILTEVPVDDAMFEILKGQIEKVSDKFTSEAIPNHSKQKDVKRNSTPIFNPATGQGVFSYEKPAKHSVPATRPGFKFKSALSDRVLRIEKLMESISAGKIDVDTDHFKDCALQKASIESESIKERTEHVGRVGNDKNPVPEPNMDILRGDSDQSVIILPETGAVKETEAKGVKRKGNFPRNPSKRNMEDEMASKESVSRRSRSDSWDVEPVTIGSESENESVGNKQFISKFDLVIRWMLYKTLLPPEITTDDFEKSLPSLMDDRIDTNICPAIKAKFEKMKSKVRNKWMNLIIVDSSGKKWLDQMKLASLQAKLHEFLRRKIMDDLQENVNEMMTYQTLCIMVLLSLGKILERDKCRLRELYEEEINTLLKEKSARENRNQQTQNYSTVQPKEATGCENINLQKMQIVRQKEAQSITEFDSVAAAQVKVPKHKVAHDSLSHCTQVNTGISLTSVIFVPVSLPLYTQSKIRLPSNSCVPTGVTVPSRKEDCYKSKHVFTNAFKSVATEIDRDKENEKRTTCQNKGSRQFKEKACRNSCENSFGKDMSKITKANPNSLIYPSELRKRYPDFFFKLEEHINSSLTKTHVLNDSFRTNLAHKIAASYAEELDEDVMSSINTRIRQSKEGFSSTEKESSDDFIIVQNIDDDDDDDDDDCISDHGSDVPSDTQCLCDFLLHKCSWCGKEYTQAASKIQHECHCKSRVPHKCAICMNAFGSMKALKNHFYVLHPGFVPKTLKTFQKVGTHAHHADVSGETRAQVPHIPNKTCPVEGEGKDNENTVLDATVVSKTYKPEQVVLAPQCSENEVSEKSTVRHLLVSPPKSHLNTNANDTSSIVETITEVDSKEQLRKLHAVQGDEGNGRQTIDIKKESQIESDSERLLDHKTSECTVADVQKHVEWASFDDENAALFPVSLSASMSDLDEGNDMRNNAAKPLSIKLFKIDSEKSWTSCNKILPERSQTAQSEEVYSPNTKLHEVAAEYSEALDLGIVKIEEDMVESQKERTQGSEANVKSESEEKHLPKCMLSVEANKHSKAGELVDTEIEEDFTGSQQNKAPVISPKTNFKSESKEEYFPKRERGLEANVNSEAVKLKVEIEEDIAESQKNNIQVKQEVSENANVELKEQADKIASLME